MYDDLVTRLREEAECPDNYPEDSNLMREAADAIEILQTLSDEQSRIIAEMGAKYQEAAAAIEELSAVCKKQEIELVELTGEVASKPRWIPVTERLPKDKERVLIFYWLSTKPKTPWYKVATFSKKLSDVDEYDLYGKDHPGFYGSDSEYGYYEHTDVEYWMPLPEPPEKESEP